jgi:hypothetical protein
VPREYRCAVQLKNSFKIFVVNFQERTFLENTEEEIAQRRNLMNVIAKF